MVDRSNEKQTTTFIATMKQAIKPKWADRNIKPLKGKLFNINIVTDKIKGLISQLIKKIIIIINK